MQFPDEKIYCHRTGFEKTCLETVVHKRCPLWIDVLGDHPQTGETIKRYYCADAVTPLILIQANQLQNQTTASVDKVAKEVKTQRDENAAIGAMAVQRSTQAIRSELLPLTELVSQTHEQHAQIYARVVDVAVHHKLLASE